MDAALRPARVAVAGRHALAHAPRRRGFRARRRRPPRLGLRGRLGARLLERVRGPLQLHRRGLSRLHQRGDRQHPPVLRPAPGVRGDRGGHRAPPGRHRASAPRGHAALGHGLGRPHARLSRFRRAPCGVLPRPRRAAEGVHPPGAGRPARGQRALGVLPRLPDERDRLRAVLPHRDAREGLRDHAARVRAFGASGFHPQRRDAHRARGARRRPGKEAQCRARLGGEPRGGVRRRAGRPPRAHAEPRPAGRRRPLLHAGLRHRHAHGARPGGALALAPAHAGLFGREAPQQRAPAHDRRGVRREGLRVAVRLRRLRLLRQHELLLRQQRLHGRRPHGHPRRPGPPRERLGRGRRGPLHAGARRGGQASRGRASPSSST